ncbi:TIGR03885 family FMN-dependent LLM class oxidoreductase [soil metagenome]
MNAPAQRYHPAIIAQAVATLNVMYPERLWVAVGSGQLLNEHITGERWPTKAERNARLRESAEVMRGLWAGETVTHRGHVTVSEARLWTRPEQPPRLVGAAVTPPTAAFVAEWADALITVVQGDDEMLDEVIRAFRSNGGEGKPMYLQVHLAWAPTEEEAQAAALSGWPQGSVPNTVATDLAHPAQVEDAARNVRLEDAAAAVRISADLGRHVKWLQGDLARGFDGIYLHEVGPEQERFVEVFGREVLPKLRPSG